MVDATQGPATLQDAVAQAVGTPAAEPAPAPDEQSGVKRDTAAQEVSEPRRKLVEKWQTEVRADKKYFDKVFKRMREDMEYARLGADKKWVDGDNYTVPIINRFINQATSALYAKNPKAVAKRKPKLLYVNWDGTQESAKSAFYLVQNGQDQSGQAAAVLQEVQQAQSYDTMMKRAGRTLEILFEYFTGEDFPDFKTRMKACVRRAKTTGVGYIEVNFHRAMEADPDVTQRIGDMTAKLEYIKSKQADVQDGKADDDGMTEEDLAIAIKTLEEEKMKIVTEGMTYDFPRSVDIIPHRKCTQLSGFIGADYVTREFLMSPDELQETFKVDIKTNYKEYMSSTAPDSTTGGAQEGDRAETNSSDAAGQPDGGAKKDTKGKAVVWRIMVKKTREVLWVCDGYPDFLKEPEAPPSQVHGFWWLIPIIFNEVEDEKEIFPPSDVNYLKHPQREYNNAREGKREHRRANRPKYFVKKGVLEDPEKTILQNCPAHQVIELAGIEGTMTIDQLIMPYKGIAIDPALYDTSEIMKDVLFGVGSQDADLGQTGDATATESSIAEQSRMSTLASNVDDLDECLSHIARISAQIMLQQLTKQTVMEIVGPGAVWPELDGQTIARELFLEIKAGSSGRPNQAQELANLERGMQWLLQLGGINPTVLARKYAYLLDIDEDELIVEGMPSVVSINAAAAQQAAAAGQMRVNAADAGNQVHVAHATGQVPPQGAQPAQPLPHPPAPPSQPVGRPPGPPKGFVPSAGAPVGAPAAPIAAGVPQPNNPNQAHNGAQGHNNTGAPPAGAGGPQPAFPAPQAHVKIPPRAPGVV